MEMLDRRTDDVENFDDMNIDALLVDEAHEYKHLGLPLPCNAELKAWTRHTVRSRKAYF